MKGGALFSRIITGRGGVIGGFLPAAHVLHAIRAPRRGRREAWAIFRMSAAATIHAQASRVCSKSGATEGGAI